MSAPIITEGAGLRAGSLSSRQVAWFEVYRFAEHVAAQHGLPLDHTLIAGTPQWCGMPDTDARKLLAVILGGVREALAHDASQAAMADASREISAAATWSALGRGRGRAYVPHRKAS